MLIRAFLYYFFFFSLVSAKDLGGPFWIWALGGREGGKRDCFRAGEVVKLLL